ncbi:hypothetical protein [Streptomyces sp. NPDC048248]|uniref:hypothetical protein n=1 Tax=Streptomyces sp. NPDC048248 TaxID=3365523 RepID=UPI003719E804
MFSFFRRAHRKTPAGPSLSSIAVVDVTAFPDRHTDRCADFAVVSQPLGPLVTELIALHTHTRHLSWLSERECCPDSYRLLARSIVREVLAGWHHQTDGRGTIGDLLTDDAHPTRRGRVPGQHGARTWEPAATRRGPNPEDSVPPQPAPEQWCSLTTPEGDFEARTPAPPMPDSSPVSHGPDLDRSELAQSAPQQDSAAWWSQARGQQ